MYVLRTISVILLAMAVGVSASARVKTTRGSLTSKASVAEVARIDTLATDTSTSATASAVTIKGYSKRASDSDETFFVTNRTDGHMGHVTITIVYEDLEGNMLHRRTETVNCDLARGETRMVKIRSFDRRRRFYYYGGDRPRKSATPFKVKMHVENYELRVE